MQKHCMPPHVCIYPPPHMSSVSMPTHCMPPCRHTHRTRWGSWDFSPIHARGWAQRPRRGRRGVLGLLLRVSPLGRPLQSLQLSRLRHMRSTQERTPRDSQTHPLMHPLMLAAISPVPCALSLSLSLSLSLRKPDAKIFRLPPRRFSRMLPHQ
jgi:hypothetical protein